MWRWASELARVRRGRKAAGAVIAPMVEKSRRHFGEIPDAAWSDPYVVGFVVMLITIITKIEIGKADEETLCQVQAKAWSDITTRTDTIGEEVILLSSTHNREFELGCQNATAFASLLFGNSISPTDADVVWEERSFGPGQMAGATEKLTERDDLSVAWELFLMPICQHTCITVVPDRKALFFK